MQGGPKAKLTPQQYAELEAFFKSVVNHYNSCKVGFFIMNNTEKLIMVADHANLNNLLDLILIEVTHSIIYNAI